MAIRKGRSSEVIANYVGPTTNICIGVLTYIWEYTL